MSKLIELVEEKNEFVSEVLSQGKNAHEAEIQFNKYIDTKYKDLIPNSKNGNKDDLSEVSIEDIDNRLEELGNG
jgi:hypothetical protein